MLKEQRDELIQVVLPWLKQCPVRPVHQCQLSNDAVSDALNSVISRSNRPTFQEAKALKHRNQIESLSKICVENFSGDLVLELGAGQGILGQTISLASQCPLVAVDRRGNTDAFDDIETHRLQTDVANFDEAQLGTAEHVAVVAKHFCGHGSDEAVDVALKLRGKLGLLCLAPCCHVTMAWENSAATREGLAAVGFPGRASEFDLLLDVLRLSRGGPKACSRWQLREQLRDDDVEMLGRKVCRILDDARLARLESHGFQVAAVEYCSKDVSPDNVVLLAAPRALTLVAAPTCIPKPLKFEHLLIEIDPAAPPSLLERLAAYLLTLKASKVLPLSSVAMESPSGQCKNMLFCTSDVGKLHVLVQELAKDVILQRIVTRFLPLTDLVEQDMHKLIEVVTDQMSCKSPEVSSRIRTLRVVGRPRSLEKTICQALPSDLLSPTHFTDVLTVAEFDSFYFSISPRQSLDPSAWSEACKDQDDRALLRFQEAISRWPKRFQNKTAAVLWTDLVRPRTEAFLLQCCSLPVAIVTGQNTSGWIGATEPSNVKVNALRGNWLPTGPSELADLLLVDISSTEREAVVALRHFIDTSCASLARHGTAILRLRCGRRPNAVKKWLRETVKQAEDLRFSRVELLHLLIDRENERTAILEWTDAIQSQPMDHGCAGPTC